MGRAPSSSMVLHPEVLARFDFAPGRGYDRRSVHEFRASALAVIDELLAERELGAGGRSDHLSDDEQAMLAAFRLLDDERRAELLGQLFALCSPGATAVTSGHARGTTYDIGVGERCGLGSGATTERRAERALGWPPPAVAMAEAARRAVAAAATWPPPGTLVAR